MFVTPARLFIVIVVVAVSLIATTRHASAKGTVVVTQSDGSHRVYQNVFIRVRGSTMSLTSSDGKGMLITGKTDCTQIDHLLRCIVYDLTLSQHGEALHPQLRSGTAWLDLSVTPRGLRLSLHTKAGTIVAANGTIDQFER